MVSHTKNKRGFGTFKTPYFATTLFSVFSRDCLQVTKQLSAPLFPKRRQNARRDGCSEGGIAGAGRRDAEPSSGAPIEVIPPMLKRC